MKLMVVESPNKVKKIESILGDGWKVVASVGHVRDLPKHDIGLEAPDFALQYEYIPPAQVQGRTFPGGEERVARIRALMGRADMIYLATDPDREGEAIAWHLKDALGLDEGDYQRVTFDEISDKAIRAALMQARKIDGDLVQAQEARRALDRIVGYLVSPLLSNMLGQNLSAGRVQSVAVRLVVDLERRIAAFKKTNHFGAVVKFDGGAWKAEWDTKPFITEDVPYVLDETLAKQAAGCRQFKVLDSGTDTAREAPPSCFSTSLMLQAASVTLKRDPELTAKDAQKLFEQGAITYIRTDSVNISDEAIAEVRAYAEGQGWKLPDAPRKFKTKAGAQEAHEAIRPTHIDVLEAGEDEHQRKLYALIWKRTVASQLADARYKVNSVTLEATDGAKPFQFKAKGRTLIEQGWRVLTAKDAVEDKTDDEAEDSAGKVPVLDVGSAKQADSGELLRKVTKAPPRFTKASLIKKLEDEGIGRPATYPAIMGNIMARGYLVEDKRYLVPTETGTILVEHLVKAGFEFMELAFTRELESQLDRIAEGEREYLDVVAPAYDQLKAELAAIAQGGDFKPRFACPKCSAGLRKHQKPGKLPIWYCTNDECKTFLDDVDGKPVERKEHPCPKCSTPLRRYKKKAGGLGWFCPTEDCKTFMDDDKGRPVEPKVHPCPKCSSPLRRFQKKDKESSKPIKGAFAWFCTNDECKTFLDDEKGQPVAIKTAPCPSCGKPMYRRKGQYGYWWGCSGFKDGCKVIMDDQAGKPVPKQAKGAKPAAKATVKRAAAPTRLVLKTPKK
jgi:DNA topoisomerase-1